jgi:hypothetical protein
MAETLADNAINSLLLIPDTLHLPAFRYERTQRIKTGNVCHDWLFGQREKPVTGLDNHQGQDNKGSLYFLTLLIPPMNCMLSRDYSNSRPNVPRGTR